jgi:hypothetical protein
LHFPVSYEISSNLAFSILALSMLEGELEHLFLDLSFPGEKAVPEFRNPQCSAYACERIMVESVEK